MPNLATNPARLATSSHRAQLLAEAVTSAYIDEIARSARPRQRAVSAPRRTPARVFRTPAAHPGDLLTVGVGEAAGCAY